jgi:hypothetical protein
MAITLASLIDVLAYERQPIRHIWQALGCQRRELAALLTQHRDQLHRVGIRLHGATKEERSGGTTRYIEVQGVSYAAISRTVPVEFAGVVMPVLPEGFAGYILARIVRGTADVVELVAIRDGVQSLIDQAASSHIEQRDERTASGEIHQRDERTAPHLTYRLEKIGKNKSGPYWYAYWREDGKLRKKYIGKERPDESP